MDVLRAIDRWPGTAVAAVVHRERGVVGARGPVDRRYALASVTKPLVATACWVAHEEGSLPFEATTLVNGPGQDTTTPVAVADLLAHSGGVDPDQPRLVAVPGRRRIYSNAGFDRLGDALAAATGVPVASYLREAICEPLGMSATALEGSAAKDAHGTADDLTRLLSEWLRPTLIDSRTLQDATSVHRPALAGVLPGFGRQDPNDWGLGVEIKGTKRPHWSAPEGSPATFGHFGRSGTLVWVDPDAGVALVALTDAGFGPWAQQAWPALSSAVLRALAG